MSIFLKLAYLFFIGAVSGWVIELLFRRFVSMENPERKWINPGFCTGPYLPLYGFGLCFLYLIASTEEYFSIDKAALSKVILILVMGLVMTAIEYIAGILALKVMKVRLWDYRREWGNLQGIICPRFSLIWTAVGALYYFFIHPHILEALSWLARNLTFSFVIGLFFGVFLVDVVNSVQLVTKIRAYAKENELVVKLEAIKADIRRYHDRTAQKYHFFRPFHSDKLLSEHLKSMRENIEALRKKKH